MTGMRQPWVRLHGVARNVGEVDPPEPEDIDPLRRLVTVEEAAILACVTVAIVRHWVQERRLVSVAQRGRAHLFVARDVLLVERAHRVRRNG